MKDTDQYMEDLIVEGIADTPAEMGKGGLTGDIILDTRIGPIPSSPVFIAKCLQKSIHVLESINISKQVQQKQTYGIMERPTKPQSIG